LYTVQDGDTLADLAQRNWGDAALWYVLADANGLARGPQDALSAGSSLKVPRLVRSTNTSTSFAVYEPSRIIGNTSPEAVMPPPPPAKGGCGGIGMILVIVVMVVATIVTAGAAAIAMGAASSSMGVMAAGSAVLSGTLGATAAVSTGIAASIGMTAATVASAAIGGAVGSIVSQGVGIAIGVQDKFSWKQVGLSAVGSAVTAGMGAAVNGPALGKQVADMGYYGTALKAAAGNALTQGVAVATGLQDKFSWRSVAASAVAAPAIQALSSQLGDGIANALDGKDGIATRTAMGTINGVVGQGVRMLVTRQGKMDYASIAADAFGNAIGESIVEESVLDGRVQMLKEGAGLDANGRVSSDFVRALARGLDNEQVATVLGKEQLVLGLRQLDRGAGASNEDVTANLARVEELRQRKVAERMQSAALGGADLNTAGDSERALAPDGNTAVKLERVVVTGQSPASSGVQDLLVGGYNFAVAIKEAYDEHPFLVKVGYEAAKTVLSGGPLKQLAMTVGKQAFNSAVAESRAWVSNKVETALSDFVADLGWSADLKLGSTAVHMAPTDFGGIAGQVGGAVVDAVFDAGIGALKGRVGDMQSLVARAQLRDPKTGRYTIDPSNPRSPNTFNDSDRRREWKRIANDPNSRLDQAQRDEVKARGWRGPQRLNDYGEIETMELSHEPIPLRDGGKNVEPKWPDEHAAVDKHRKLKKR
ncbi:MAG TPA: LysM domain-containing protein, partial [Roseateles sp.]